MIRSFQFYFLVDLSSIILGIHITKYISELYFTLSISQLRTDKDLVLIIIINTLQLSLEYSQGHSSQAASRSTRRGC